MITDMMIEKVKRQINAYLDCNIQDIIELSNTTLVFGGALRSIIAVTRPKAKMYHPINHYARIEGLQNRGWLVIDVDKI